MSRDRDTGRIQALLDKNMSFMTWLSPEDWDNLLAQSRIRTRKSF
jgi:hypothetical protein